MPADGHDTTLGAGGSQGSPGPPIPCGPVSVNTMFIASLVTVTTLTSPAESWKERLPPTIVTVPPSAEPGSAATTTAAAATHTGRPERVSVLTAIVPVQCRSEPCRGEPSVLQPT